MGSLCEKSTKTNFDKHEPQKPPKQASETKPTPIMVRALYDYDGINHGDLIFTKGDQMFIIDNTSDPDWWKAEKVKDHSRGYIPSNFVVVDDTVIENQEWWFEVDRRTACHLLKHPSNDIGAFMIRKCEDNQLKALSVLNCKDIIKNMKIVKHFKIREESGEFYLQNNTRFKSIFSLVEYYHYNTIPGDKYCLGHPCVREQKNVPFRSLEVERSSVQILEKLGDGMFGQVMKGLINKKQHVAVKMLKENSLMKKEEFEKEAMTLHQLRHPRIVQLMGICMQEEPYYIITEFMSNGSLLIFLKSNSELLEIGQLIDISAQIADGMSYLAKQNPPFIHRDLRAANCLVNENNIAKVADFGLAKMIDDGIYEGGETCKFPVKWTAPEGLEAKMFSVKSDVWSYGILMYEIFTIGKIPYPGWDNMKIRTEVIRGHQLGMPANTRVPIPKEVKEVMARCLTRQSEERPSFSEIKAIFCSLNTGTDSYQSVEDAART